MNVSVTWPWPVLLIYICIFGISCGIGEAIGQEIALRYRTRKLKKRLHNEGRSIRS